MRFRVLALDFDGTIALDGNLDPEVAIAVAELRAHGVAVLIVTGRILSDLRCRLGSLRAFDAVVAENGAVLAFPQSGTSRLLAPPPSPELQEALHARGLPFLAGQCLIECEASRAPLVLAVIRELELPLVIHFNRGRMMVLPQAVSKATGLEQTLRTLRLSAHDTLAIGDAENDHQLLETSEVGVAVSWGSASSARRTSCWRVRGRRRWPPTCASSCARRRGSRRSRSAIACCSAVAWTTGRRPTCTCAGATC